MTRYEIRPAKPILFDGKTLTPADVLATFETDHRVRDVTALVHYGNAACHKCGDGEDSDSESETDENNAGDGADAGTPVSVDPGADAGDEPQGDSVEGTTETTGGNDFAEFSADVQESLKAEGITTFAQAAIWLRDNGSSFVKLDHIGDATNVKLISAISEAGFPVA